MEVNNTDTYEFINVTINPINHPIAFGERVASFIASGMDEVSAKKLSSEPIEMEVYFDKCSSLILLDSGAVESGKVYNPYDGVRFVDNLIELEFTTTEKMQIIQTFGYEIRLSVEGIKIIDTHKDNVLVLSGTSNEIDEVLTEFLSNLWGSIDDTTADAYNNSETEFFTKCLNDYKNL